MMNLWKCGQRCTRSCPKGREAHNGLPLSDAPAGKPLKVKSIGGGRHLCARMAAMGIYPGVEMELLCAGCGSPCLVRVHGGTLSLGKGVSEKILVTSRI